MLAPREREQDTERRVNGTCPYCHAEPWHEAGAFLAYRCGSIASRVTGLHFQDCNYRVLEVWGPI